MDHLDRTGDAVEAFGRGAGELAAGVHEQRTDPLAAAKDGVSLAGEARDMETGKDALAGDDPAKSTKSRTGQDIAQ